MAELPDVPSLRTLKPPSGGLQALRAKLDEPARHRAWIVVPTLVIASVLAMVVIGRRPRPDAPTTATPAQAIRDRSIGETFYWVASMPGTPRAAHGPVVSIDDAPRVHGYPLPPARSTWRRGDRHARSR